MQSHIATVLGTRRLSAHLTSVTLEVAAGYASTGVPDEYVRILIPPVGADLVLPEIGDDLTWSYPEGAVEPAPRVYTISDHRLVDGRVQVDVDIALHEVGTGSDWVRRVQVGDQVGITDPRGLYAAAPDVAWQLLVSDITGIPALARILRGLRPEQRAEVVVVLTDPADEIALPSAADVDVAWTVVADERRISDTMAAAVLDRELPTGAYVWLAGEARASRAVRKHLRRTLKWSQDAFYTCGYWQLDAERWNARYEQVAQEVEPEAVAAYRKRLETGDEGAYLDQLEDIYEKAGL